MTLTKALNMLQKEYERAQKLEYVRDPVAYALHKVWKMADAEKPPTSLTGKCGSCEYAIPTTFGSSECYIECTNRLQNRPDRTGIAHIKQRTTPACKRYKKKENDHEQSCIDLHSAQMVRSDCQRRKNGGSEKE